MSSRKALYAVAAMVPLLMIACSPMATSGVCVHKASPWSEYECPDTNRFVEASSIESAMLTLQLTDGSKRQIRLPKGADAVFFTRMSSDSVLGGYYQQRDTTVALRLRSELGRR